ncbi:MAG: hypothetical protein ACRC8A_04720 [Microcoleaceae cyanobacterium]
MNPYDQFIDYYYKASPQIIRWERRRLLQAFWIGVAYLVAQNISALQSVDPLTALATLLIAITALYPSYLWCSGKALGMPVFPFFTLMHLWTHALPLISNHPAIVEYSPENHLFAGFTVASYLVVGTFFWLSQIKSSEIFPTTHRVLMDEKGENLFLLMITCAVFFNMYSLGKWFSISGGILALVRGGILGLSILAIFVLCYRLGEKTLNKFRSSFFILLMAAYLISSAAGLILRDSVGVLSVAFIAYILGSRRIPIITMAVLLSLLTLLHYGKGEMRGKYWFQAETQLQLQPWEYPAWYSEWVGYSLESLGHSEEETESESSPQERSSIIQMLLLAQKKTPEELPYLQGKSYLILPQMIVPRFLNPNKPRSHEGTYLLSIYYGLQSEEDTIRTTIAWGLVAESYANFGLVGCWGLGAFWGIFYGKATRWSLNTSILSSRSLFLILLISFAAQSEWTASVYVASLFQSSMVLMGMTFTLMKVHQSFTAEEIESIQNSFYLGESHE